MRLSDPLYEARQRFRFRCQETRTDTDSKYLGRSCLIITEALDPNSSDASKKVEQCLGMSPNSDTSVINGGLKAASCQEAAANGGQFLWHIRKFRHVAVLPTAALLTASSPSRSA